MIGGCGMGMNQMGGGMGMYQMGGGMGMNQNPLPFDSFPKPPPI